MSHGQYHTSTQSAQISLPHAKRSIVRSHRPAPLTRRSTPKRLAAKKAEKKGDDMTTSFLQFCATCEKQIEVPNNSILYCSESCRRKDSAKPIFPVEMSTPTSPTQSSPATSPAPREILPPFTPTSPLRIPPYPNHSKSDLDPTEWKPKLAKGRGATSEAFAYLQQFHRIASDTDAGPDGTTSTSMPARVTPAVPSRPRVSHRSTTSMSALFANMHMTSAAPSLANTPTTAASSVGSQNGVEFIDITYDFSTRPLPPRRNPMSFDGAKGIELVTPHAAPANSASHENKDLWGKKVVVKRGSSDNFNGQGLGSLFK